MAFCVLGSCVTRDIWAVTNEPFRGKYFARSSFATLTTPPYPLEEQHLVRLTSAFQRESVLSDAKRTALEWISVNKPDLIILDFIDERFDLIDVDGTILSNSWEFKASGVAGELFRQYKVIDRYSSEAFDIWKRGLHTLMSNIQSSSPESAIVLHKAWAQTHILDGGQETPWDTTLKSPGNQASISDFNSLLARYYDECSNFPQINVIEMPRSVQYSAKAHRWGSHPVHYIDDYSVCARAALSPWLP